MKILMTVLQFPPFGGAAVSRIYSFAKYWSRAGHDVTILTPKKYAFMGQTDYIPEGYASETFKVIEVPYTSPLLVRGRGLGRDIGESVSSEDTSARWLRKLRSGLRKLRRNVIGSSIDVHRIWQSALTQEAVRLLEQEKFDVLFSSFSPQASHAVASAAKAYDPSLLWVADYRDLWTGNHLLRMHPLVAFFQKRKECRLLKSADMLTTVSGPLAEYLRQLHQKDVEVIFNGYDHEEWTALSQAPFFPSDGIFRIVYTGTIYEGSRDPSPLFEAIKDLDRAGEVTPDRLQIYFYGDSANVADIARKYRVLSYIQEGGMLGKQDALRTQRDANLLLFLESAPTNGSLSAQGVLTSKIFEYMASGTPVLAVGIEEDSPIGKFLQQTNSGETAGRNVDKIKAILLQYMQSAHKTKMKERALIREYRRENQAKRLERKIVDMLEERRKQLGRTRETIE